MNYLKAYLIVCFACFKLVGQVYFDRQYNTGFNNLLSSMVYTQPDSGFVMLNYIRDSITQRQDFGLLKLDKNGNELLKKKYNMFNYGYGAYLNGMNHFVPATKSSFFLTVAITPSNTNKCCFVLLNKVNRTTLDTIKSIIHGPDTSIWSNLTNYVKLNESKYLLVGAGGNSKRFWPAIVELDSNLNLNKKVKIGSPLSFIPNNAIQNPITKQLLMLGQVITSTMTGIRPLGILHTDTTGAPLQCAKLEMPFWPFFSGKVVFSSFDTTYVLTGILTTATLSGRGVSKIAVIKFNSKTLSPIWHYTYGDEAVINGAYNLVVEPNGSIVISGMYSPFGSTPLFNDDYRGVIIKLDVNGQFIWCRDYNKIVSPPNPNKPNEGFYGIDKTKDKGYILVGSTHGLPNAPAWAVKVDSTGCVSNTNCPSLTFSAVPFAVNFSTVSISSSTILGNDTGLQSTDFFEHITIYPNPTNDFLNVEVEDIKTKTIELINNLGQIVLKLKTEEKRTQLDISSLSNGIYFLKIQNQQAQKTFKVVKE